MEISELERMMFVQFAFEYHFVKYIHIINIKSSVSPNNERNAGINPLTNARMQAIRLKLSETAEPFQYYQSFCKKFSRD